jgi:hypothetical protein
MWAIAVHRASNPLGTARRRRARRERQVDLPRFALVTLTVHVFDHFGA